MLKNLISIILKNQDKIGLTRNDIIKSIMEKRTTIFDNLVFLEQLNIVSHYEKKITDFRGRSNTFWLVNSFSNSLMCSLHKFCIQDLMNKQIRIDKFKFFLFCYKIYKKQKQDG